MGAASARGSGLGIVLVVLAACGGDGDDGPGPTTTIGPAGGVVGGAGARVVVPERALAGRTQITVTRVDLPTPLPPSLEAAGPAIAFLPHGLRFSAAVTVEIPFSGDGAALSVQRLDDATDTTWEAVEASFASGLATVSTRSFSVYVVARPSARLDAGEDHDGGGLDAGDAGAGDADRAEAGPRDDAGSAEDAEPLDARTAEDAGGADASPPPADAGPVDAGPCGRGARSGDVEIRSAADVTALRGYTAVTGSLLVTGAVASLEGLECLGGARDLTIERTMALRDLAGLSGITVLGLLSIEDNTALVSSSGLDALGTVFGAVEIRFNASLVEIDSLSSLRSVGGDLAIQGNGALASLEGLDGVETVGGGFGVFDETALASLELSSLRSVAGSLEVQSCPMATSVGFPALTTATDGFIVVRNDAVASIDLGRLRDCQFVSIADDIAVTSITGTGALPRAEVNLSGLASLTSLSAFTSLASARNLTVSGTALASVSFPALTRVDRALTISYNPVLTSLAGLSALTSLGESLVVADDAMLSNCEALALRDRLVAGGFAGTVSIGGNLTCP